MHHLRRIPVQRGRVRDTADPQTPTILFKLKAYYYKAKKLELVLVTFFYLT